MTAKTDRELLELAAKAAGYAIHDFYINAEAWAYQEGSEPDHDGELPIFLWKPLTDDGDALRLAVKLGMLVRTKGTATVIGWMKKSRLGEPHGYDPCAATRRAIVRAAAAIGETL